MRQRAVTNFQHTVEWQQHAKATHAIERLETLQQKLDYASNSQEAIQAMLCKPLYQEAWLRGYGTLYSAVYRPFSNSVELLWPQQSWKQTLQNFEEGKITVSLHAQF